MIDIRTMQESFQCMWISNLMNQTTSAKWTWIPAKHLQFFGKEYACLLSKIGPSKFKGLTDIKSTFWEKAISTWLTYNKNIQLHTDKRICLWNNENITHQGNVLFFKSWTNKVTFLNEIVNENGIFSFETIERLIGSKASLRLEYITVRTAVISFLQNSGNTIENPINNAPSNSKKANSAKLFRNLIVNSRYVEPCAVRFWKNKLNVDINKNTWNIPIVSTKEARLRELQWKILHNIYPTNILLQKMGLRNSNVCHFCNNHVDFVEHFFFYCPVINQLWIYISEYICKQYDVGITFTAQNVLIGFVDNNEINASKDTWKSINQLILIGKMLISKFKYGTALNLELMLQKELKLRRFDI